MSGLSYLSSLVTTSDEDIHFLLEGMTKRQCGYELREGQYFIDSQTGIGIAASGGEQNEVFYYDQTENIAVAFSGRILNCKRIQNELKSESKISSNEFASVIAYLYLLNGTEFLNKLQGYFCFIIWDGNKKQLLAVRDQMGALPVFYGEGKNGRASVIATQIQAITGTGLVPIDFDKEAIFHYLHDKSFLQPSTPYKYARSIPPGNFLKCTVNDRQLERYYSSSMLKKPIGETEAIDLGEELLRTILLDQMAPFQQIGVLFSGGVDSLLLTAMLKALTDKPIHTYTVWSGSNNADVESALNASKYFGTKQTMVELNGSIALDHLPSVIAGYPTPGVGGWQIYMGTHAMQKDGIKSAFCGHGAETSFGIDWAQNKFGQLHRLFSVLNIVPTSVQRFALKMIRKYIEKMNLQKGNRYNNITLFKAYLERRLGIHYWNSSMLTEDRIASLLEFETSSFRSVGDVYMENYSRSDSKDFVDQQVFARLATFEGNHAQGKNNHLAQLNQVELVLPFMDRRMVEFGLSIPNDLKRLNGQYKYLEVQLANKYHSFKREKAGFSMPLNKWLYDDLKPVTSQVFSEENLEKRSIFDTKAVLKLWKEYMADQSILSWADIQAIISLDLWLKHVERNAIAS